jgi:hypothetical protein
VLALTLAAHAVDLLPNSAFNRLVYILAGAVAGLASGLVQAAGPRGHMPASSASVGMRIPAGVRSSASAMPHPTSGRGPDSAPASGHSHGQSHGLSQERPHDPRQSPPSSGSG